MQQPTLCQPTALTFVPTFLVTTPRRRASHSARGDDQIDDQIKQQGESTAAREAVVRAPRDNLPDMMLDRQPPRDEAFGGACTRVESQLSS